MIYAYNKGQRCLSLLVWLLGVDYVSCTSCTACSKGHRLLGSLLWDYVATSIFWGVGPSFHAFNESRPPWGYGERKIGKQKDTFEVFCEDTFIDGDKKGSKTISRAKGENVIRLLKKEGYLNDYTKFRHLVKSKGFQLVSHSALGLKDVL